jgi:signal transduction histidine kinase
MPVTPMKPAPPATVRDSARLEALRDASLLDTPAEESFDRLTRLASTILDAPVALVSLVDEDRQFFKSCVGLPEPWASRRETPLSHSFCQHAVDSREPLLIEDAREHPLVWDNLAIRDLNVIAYAGIPLITSDGHALGSFCVIDGKPRRWTNEEIAIVKDLSESVVTEIELRATARLAEQAIEDREHLLRELDVERERLQSIFMQAPAFIAVFRGPEHVFELVNPPFHQLIGHREVIGKPVREALPEVEGQGYFELLDQVYTTGEPFVGNEARVLLQREKDGPLEERFVNFVYQPLVGPGDSVSGIFVHGVDVTDQVHARQEVEELSSAKSDFLAVMSHELRTPLSAILDYSELLLMGVPEPIPTGAVSQVERIDVAARHLLQLIEEILSFSRVEAGKEEVRMDSVELTELAREAVSFIQPLAEKQGLTLEVRLPERAIPTVTDRGKVRQILINLLSNAVKFTPAGEVRLEVVGAGNEALLHVRDTGVGIAPEHLDKVFEPFWQVQQSATREINGTGLGLSVSYKIAKLLGGDLRVESAPGMGSTFTLVLPLRG